MTKFKFFFQKHSIKYMLILASVICVAIFFYLILSSQYMFVVRPVLLCKYDLEINFKSKKTRIHISGFFLMYDNGTGMQTSHGYMYKDEKYFSINNNTTFRYSHLKNGIYEIRYNTVYKKYNDTTPDLSWGDFSKRLVYDYLTFVKLSTGNVILYERDWPVMMCSQ